jgi:hypothetical protein
MSLSKRTIGLLALCVLALGAFAAQAGAATNGTTAFTCKETGEGNFTKAHCAAADTGAGKFSHVAIPQNTTTEVSGSNEKTGSETTASTPAIIKTAATGIASVYTFEASGVTAAGTLTNEIVGTEHVARGTLTFTYTGVKVTSPAETGCKVKGEKIETAPLAVTTAGQGMEIQLAPAEGAKFLEFTVEGCSKAVLNTKGTVNGNINATLDGATLKLSEGETTEQGTLTVGAGPMVVGIGSPTTLSARAPGAGPFTPLSFTTVQT